MSNKYKGLAKDTAVFAIGNFGSKVLSFLCVSLYTSYLTTAEYGEADALTTTVALLLPIFSLAISEAVLRFFYDKEVDTNQVVSIGIKTVILSSVLSALLTTIACVFFPKLTKYALYFVIIFSLTTLESVLSSVTKGQGKSRAFAIKGLIYTAAFIASNIIFLTVFRMGLNGYFCAYIVAYTTSCGYMCFADRIFNYKISIGVDKSLLRNMLMYSIPYIPATISWWINSSADKYMLIGLIGAGANGVYSVAQKIPTIITAVTGIFTQAWQLSALRNYKDSDFTDYFSEVFRLLSALLLFGTCVIFIFNKPIATVLFKNDFYEAWKYVPMLTVAAIFSTIAGFLASAFTTAKKTNVLFISTCVAAGVNIIINFVLITLIGALGAAIATAISFLVMVVVRIITMRRFIELKVNYTRWIISVILVFNAAIVLPYVEQYYWVAIGVSVVIFIVNLQDCIDLCKSIIHKVK